MQRFHTSRPASVLLAALTLILLWAALPCLAAEPADAPATDAPADNRCVIEGVPFIVAKGMRLEKVAGEPLVKWPIVTDWDEQGRLVVAESGGVARPLSEHNKQKLHRIIRLVDNDGDGVFDQRIVAADQMAFPEGVLCVGNAILVAAPPQIWKLTDADDDGVCEQREVWFDGTTITGCGNDLHGPYLGRDGWIYWCKGAFAEQQHPLLDGRTLQTTAAHIFRRQLDGGAIESVIAGGMDNPVEVAMIPEGEKFFTSTFLQHPGDGLRDGIAHAVYGGVHGKQHDVLANHPRTGPLMPIMTQLGPAAPSGLACLHSQRLTQDLPRADGTCTLAAALFNLQKWTAHQLIVDGASYRTVDHDLVVAERVDVHPTDVLEDADGSLLLIDTGGWYDLCCPSSRVDQKTAAGGIYRLSAESSSTQTPDSIQWADLQTPAVTELLFDARPWVRRRAARELDTHADTAAAPLVHILNDPQRPLDDRLTALWALCRLGNADAIQAIGDQLQSADASLQQAACHALAIHHHAEARQPLEALLTSPELRVARAAAEALGQIGDAASAPHLIAALGAKLTDRHLEHSLLYALIQIARRHPTIDLLRLADSDTKRYAALLVLDRTDQTEALTADRLFAALESDEAKLRELATELLAKHPQWAGDSNARLQRLYADVSGPGDPAAAALDALLATWKHESAMQAMIAAWLTGAVDADAAKQRFLANDLDAWSPAKMPNSWAQPLADWLRVADADVQNALIDSLAKVEMESAASASLAEALEQLASQKKDLDQRLRFLTALPKNHGLRDAQLDEQIVGAFCSDESSRAALAARALDRVRLNPAAASVLADSLPRVAPQSLITAIEAIHRSGNANLEDRMLQTLASLASARTLPQTFLTNLYKDAAPPLRERAQETTAVLTRPSADIQATIEKRLAEMLPGDPLRGLQVFHGSKAACSACHRMGYVGNDLGPELTRIGSSRTPEALLEAILFPSARLEQSYQSTRVLTVDGQIYNGLVRRHDERSIELQLNAEKRVSIAAEDVEALEPSEVSVMPQGMAELLSAQELSDLMALLQSTK